MKGQPFVTKLAAEPRYRLGDPILITFEIENTSSSTQQMLKWGTPLEGQFTVDCLTVKRGDQTIRYDGKFVKRGDPPSEAYVVIGPGERLKETLDLSEAYAIDQVGEYTVTLNASFFDAFTVQGSTKQAPRKRQNHQSHKLPEATVQFKIVEGTEPKITAGQAARKASKLAKSSARAPDFNGGTSAQQADTVTAHNNAQYFSGLAANQLNAGPADTNALYQTWFGAFDQGRYDAVTKDFSDISNTLLTEQVTYDLTGDECEPGWFAYTYNGSRTIWLCGEYLSAPQIGTDCKFGTLIHEWSHAVCDTDDNVYGESGCLALAGSDPGEACDNADSHEYFAERLAQSDFGKSLTFITDRSTFGKDEIDTMLAQATPAVAEKAFYVMMDGYWPDKLGITPSSLGTSPNVKPSITFAPSVPGMTVSVTSLEAEDTALPVEPQRFTWVCQVTFNNSSGFPSDPGQVKVVTLTASLSGLSSSAQIRLIREPNPYELDGEVSWLSMDLRVFQIRAGEPRFGVTMGSTPANASAFITQVVANLNAGTAAGQTFESISTDMETSALELSEKVNGVNVFNFAVGKVRYRGTIDISNVRVFFRLFPAATTSINFDLNTTYRRTTQAANTIALPGLSGNSDLLTIPCFAEQRVDSSAVSVATQTDPSNVRTIAHDPSGDEAPAYFGCWLDINQTRPQYPTKPSPSDGPWSSGRRSVQELMRNAHQCLVAEIAFDPDPIPDGASPAGSDKLAQRNLVIVESANPGYEASRRILTTFDLHPVAVGKEAQLSPDELLIDWGNTPSDSVATIYIPEIEAEQIIALADARYGIHRLRRKDARTLELPVGGICYVPLPPGTAFGLTGLLSVDLPSSIRRGEVYTIVVRQVTNAAAKGPSYDHVDVGVVRKKASQASMASHGESMVVRWRRIVGSYQITIPVRTKEVMLARETRLLSVLRWILKSVPAGDRWHPVFSRYVGLIGERVSALGGDLGQVEPSPAGTGGEPGREPAPDHERRLSYNGKVAGLIYDCFGDFEGFLLDDCGTEIGFQAREHQIEMLVRIAWRERIAITVVTGSAHPRRPLSIILRRAPEPFQS